jgi:ribosome-associated protein
MIRITDKIEICDDDLVFKASRSSGPGGQNVNKLNTRVTLLLDVLKCKVLSDSQKQQVLARLSTRVDKDGVVRVVSQKFRSQKENRDAALARLEQLLRDALKELPVRRPTKVPVTAHRKRLDAKKRRSILKQQRARKVHNLSGDE